MEWPFALTLIETNQNSGFGVSGGTACQPYDRESAISIQNSVPECECFGLVLNLGTAGTTTYGPSADQRGGAISYLISLRTVIFFSLDHMLLLP